MTRTDNEIIGRGLFWGSLILLTLVIAISSITIIGPGERGVLKSFGAITGTVFDEGLNFKVPIMHTVDKIDIKILKYETTASAASKDLQVVQSSIALNYRVRTDSVIWLRQNIGMDYRSKLIEPSIQEAIKSSMAKFTAEELITKRLDVRSQMNLILQEKLDKVSSNSIQIEDFNIVNFEFSEEFDAAIEAKATAEQLALKANRDLDRIKVEAQQKIESAKAEAESLRIQSEAIKQSKDILQLRWIEKWDGQLPTYVGGGESLILDMKDMNDEVA